MPAGFGVDVPLVLADAERVPLQDSRFGLRSPPLDPGGRPLLSPGVPAPLTTVGALCASPGAGSTARLRPRFGLRRLDWGRSAGFHLPHGQLLGLLGSHGFRVEDLIELQAPRDAHRDVPYVSAHWAPNWPSEEIWKTRLAG
jgi:hypothetical protein